MRANASTCLLTPQRLHAADALYWCLWPDSVVYTRSGDMRRREDMTPCASAVLMTVNGVACINAHIQYQVISVTKEDSFNCTYKLCEKLIEVKSSQKGTQCQHIASCLYLHCTQHEVQEKAIAKVISCCLRVGIYTRGLTHAH